MAPSLAWRSLAEKRALTRSTRRRGILRRGEVAERSNAAVLKTVDRKIRGFESHPLRQGMELRWHPTTTTTPTPTTSTRTRRRSAATAPRRTSSSSRHRTARSPRRSGTLHGPAVLPDQRGPRLRGPTAGALQRERTDDLRDPDVRRQAAAGHSSRHVRLRVGRRAATPDRLPICDRRGRFALRPVPRRRRAARRRTAPGGTSTSSRTRTARTRSTSTSPTTRHASTPRSSRAR